MTEGEPPGTLSAEMGRCYEFGVVIHEGCEHTMVVSPEGGACLCGSCGASCTGRFRGCDAVLALPGHIPIAAPEPSRLTSTPAGVPVALRSTEVARPLHDGPAGTSVHASPGASADAELAVIEARSSATSDLTDIGLLSRAAVPAEDVEVVESIGGNGSVPAKRVDTSETVLVSSDLAVIERIIDRSDRAVEVVAQMQEQLAIRDEALAEAFDRLALAQQALVDRLGDDQVASAHLRDLVIEVSQRLEGLETQVANPYFLGLRLRKT